MTNSMTYYFTDAITEAFVNERANVFNPYSSFKEIDGIDEWYNVSTWNTLNFFKKSLFQAYPMQLVIPKDLQGTHWRY